MVNTPPAPVPAVPVSRVCSTPRRKGARKRDRSGQRVSPLVSPVWKRRRLLENGSQKRGKSVSRAKKVKHGRRAKGNDKTPRRKRENRRKPVKFTPA